MTFGSKTTRKSLWLWIPSIYFAQCMFVWWLLYVHYEPECEFWLGFCLGGNTTKGQLISKANCQAVNSSKKRTNEFVFTSLRLEIEHSKKAFRNYLTFNILT